MKLQKNDAILISALQTIGYMLRLSNTKPANKMDKKHRILMLNASHKYLKQDLKKLKRIR